MSVPGSLLDWYEKSFGCIAHAFLFVGLTTLLCLFGPTARTENAMPNVSLPDVDRNIRVLNVPPESVEIVAVKTVAKKIMDLFDQGKLVPTRVEIFDDHPIVKDALAEKTIQIDLAKGKAVTILAPISHNGNRIIVKKNSAGTETYTLYSLPSDSGVDLKDCLKPTN